MALVNQLFPRIEAREEASQAASRATSSLCSPSRREGVQLLLQFPQDDVAAPQSQLQGTHLSFAGPHAVLTSSLTAGASVKSDLQPAIYGRAKGKGVRCQRRAGKAEPSKQRRQRRAGKAPRQYAASDFALGVPFPTSSDRYLFGEEPQFTTYISGQYRSVCA